MRIVINTPTSQISSALARTLLDRGHAVTAIARDPAKVADLAARGARIVAGSIEDPAVLDDAFRGADAVFWLTPPAYRPGYRAWQVELGERAADRAKAAGITRAVVLSSVGAQSPDVGPVTGVGLVEGSFRRALPDVTALRPGNFMENLLHDVGSIAAQGVIYSPIPADKKYPVVATRDIAASAFTELTGGATGHRIVGVHGPADLTPVEVAAAISRAIGKPVQHVEVTVEQARAGMIGAGMPDFAADLFAEMYAGFRSGHMDAAEPRTAATTTPTTLEAWAREHLRPRVS